MTNTNTASGAVIPRYKIGYRSDEWGMRSSTPSGIPDHAGAWVRYEDHIAALVDAQQPAPSAAAAEPSAHAAWSAFERLASNQGPDTDDRDKAGMVLIRDYLMRAARVGRYRAPQPSPTPQADSQPAPIDPAIAADLERSDWTPEEALRWYAAGKHYDTVPNGDGSSSARILDNGAVASNALKSLSREYAEHKGDVALQEPTPVVGTIAHVGTGKTTLTGAIASALRAAPAQQLVAPTEKYDDTLLPFLALMRKELHANADKGDRPGWLKVSADQALLEIYWHTAKLSAAVKNNDGPALIEHSADVANTAMMLLDVCGGIPTPLVAPSALEDWRLDHSAGRPILVYKDCSVIEAEQAQEVLDALRASRGQAPACQHRIVDARNPIIKSGYVCLDCGALFAAGDHDAAQAPSVLEDAARYLWLAAHCRITSEHWGGRWSIIVDGPAPELENGEYLIDEAIDAARKQGANHD